MTGQPRFPRSLRCGLWLLAFLSMGALFADFLSPYSPVRQHREFPATPPTGLRAVSPTGEAMAFRFLAEGEEYRLLGLFPARVHLFGAEEPGRIFLLGTDALGRDLWSRLLHGARRSLSIAFVSLLVALPLALAIGCAAGYYGGAVDFVLMRAVELLLALPALYLIIGLRSALPLDLEPDRVFLAMIGVIAFFGWAHLARLIRGLALSLRTREFILAATAAGAGDLRILLRHMLPHLRSFSLTQAALMTPGFLLAEITLSYLGLGVPEPLPSWGSMLAATVGLPAAHLHWWNLTPLAAIFLASLSFQLVADGLKAHFDLRAPAIAPPREAERPLL